LRCAAACDNVTGRADVTSPALALVVPCYNEAARLDPDAFLRFVSSHPQVQLVMVDDGSEDGTKAVLEAMRKAAPEAVTVVCQPVRSGKAEAVRHCPFGRRLDAVSSGHCMRGP